MGIAKVINIFPLKSFHPCSHKIDHNFDKTYKNKSHISTTSSIISMVVTMISQPTNYLVVCPTMENYMWK